MPLIDTKTRERIREFNDAFRTTFGPKLGKAMLTSGVNSLPSDVRAMAIRKTATFDAFTPENDPHGEHDFGNFEIAGKRFFFKIDYFDPNLGFGSDDAADPEKTTRMFTLMLAEEYRHISTGYRHFHCLFFAPTRLNLSKSALRDLHGAVGYALPRTVRFNPLWKRYYRASHVRRALNATVF